MEALTGAGIAVSAAGQLADPGTGDPRRRGIDVTADGAGSTVRLDALVNFSDANGSAAGDTDEIGRAPCRGRVEISVVAVSFKKKSVDVALDGTRTIATAPFRSFQSAR